MAENEVLVGTRKGLFVLRGDRGGPMQIAARCFEREPVEYACFDPRTGTYLAAVKHWPEEMAQEFFPGSKFGPHVYLATDPAGDWEDVGSFQLPEGEKVTSTWVIQPGTEEGVLWAGVMPAALFRSDDGGRSWRINQPLWDEPTRPSWQPGGAGLCLHSICPDPSDPARLSIAISSAGVWSTEDGGAHWRRTVKGLPRWPEGADDATGVQCVHNMHRVPSQPDTLYLQYHGGVFRSDDGAGHWESIAEGLPSDFGLPLAIDAHNPDRAFVIPLGSEMDRVTAEGKVRVFETSDRGHHWQALTNGLPQKDAYLTVLREAFTGDGADPLGLFFGATSGVVFGSGDGGASWFTAADHLPPVLSVRMGMTTVPPRGPTITARLQPGTRSLPRQSSRRSPAARPGPNASHAQAAPLPGVPGGRSE